MACYSIRSYLLFGLLSRGAGKVGKERERGKGEGIMIIRVYDARCDVCGRRFSSFHSTWETVERLKVELAAAGWETTKVLQNFDGMKGHQTVSLVTCKHCQTEAEMKPGKGKSENETTKGEGRDVGI
jgi:hypothetical protein